MSIHRILQLALLPLGALFCLAAGPKQPGKGGPGGGATVEPAVVPEYLFNVLVSRPGADRVTMSVVAWKDLEGKFVYGLHPDALDQASATFALRAGEPLHVPLGQLAPNSQYYYRFLYRLPQSPEPVQDDIRSFHTQRAASETFRFVVQADSHLDVSTDVLVYQQTLANMLQDRPDFLVDLGDTFMVDKFGPFYPRAEAQYRAQRYYLGQIGHSVPIFLTLGNHDGETGSRLTGDPGCMPLWSLGMRKKFFANPEPEHGAIYSANMTPLPEAGLLQNYYAWEWGSALFIVLDPFWPTTRKGGQDNWSMTLGEDQYRWLTSTLEKSQATFKFAFIHHLVGGLGRDVRGGATSALYMEWGGRNADGTEGFQEHRPGWALPIHQLLVKNRASIVFHGHDHLYAKEELDGLIYQEVPQPGHPSGGTRSAEEYKYTGTILGSSGHLRVTVAPQQTTVDYVRTSVPGVTKSDIGNAVVEHQYILPRR
jgi:hypothetical protein